MISKCFAYWVKRFPIMSRLYVLNIAFYSLQYADLDEFLSENNIPDGLPGTHLGHSTGLGHRNDSMGHSTGLTLGLGHITTKRERSPSPSDCVSPDTISPPSPAESSMYRCISPIIIYFTQILRNVNDVLKIDECLA